MQYSLEYVEEEIEDLKMVRDQLKSGKEFCNHKWNRHDHCFDCYCHECGRFVTEAHEVVDMPFKDELVCKHCTDGEN